MNYNSNSTQWWKSRQKVRIKLSYKQEFEGEKSCQINALLNVNTDIWQDFELVENRTVWWEIGLFWRNFHHRGPSGRSVSLATPTTAAATPSSNDERVRELMSRLPPAPPIQMGVTTETVTKRSFTGIINYGLLTTETNFKSFTYIFCLITTLSVKLFVVTVQIYSL